MSAKRCGLASLLLNIKGPTPRFTKLVSFAVSGEFYFTSLLLGFPHRLVVARKSIFRLTAHNELKFSMQIKIAVCIKRMANDSIAIDKAVLSCN